VDSIHSKLKLLSNKIEEVELMVKTNRIEDCYYTILDFLE